MSLNLTYSYGGDNLVNALQDLVVRFVINCPRADLETTERLFFQLEEAQWYYEDFVRVENPSFPSMKMKTFCEQLFASCPILYTYSEDMESDLMGFQSYKSVIPVCGAIILNKEMTKALMVKGWKAGASWGFPKGKINKNEPYEECAVREVYEEIGFDISPFLQKDDFVEIFIQGKKTRLYIIRGVPVDTQFCPQTRKEISKIEWHSVKELPAFSGTQAKSTHNYFMVAPFMPELKSYISKAKGLATNLTKIESEALKNLLGVGGANGAQVLEQNDEDKAAEQLLSLIRPKQTSASPKSDTKILMNLLHQGGRQNNEQQDLESAREILSLLKTEIKQEEHTQSVDFGNSRVPGIPRQVPFGMPFNMPAGFPHKTNFTPPHMQPSGFFSLPPMAHVPPPSFIDNGQYQHHESNSNGPEPKLPLSHERPEYSAPARPPPPPNTILMSLLNKKNNKTGNRVSATNRADPLRFESRGNVNDGSNPLKLSDLSQGDQQQKPGGALLSLLGGSSPGPDRTAPVVANSPSSSGGSLMHFLNAGASSSSANASASASDNASALPSTSSRGSGVTYEATAGTSSVVNQPRKNQSQHPIQNIEADKGRSLLGLLGLSRPNPATSGYSGANTNAPPPIGRPAASSSASGSLLSLLHPAEPSFAESSFAEQSTTGSNKSKPAAGPRTNLLNLLSPSPEASPPPVAVSTPEATDKWREAASGPNISAVVGDAAAGPVKKSTEPKEKAPNDQDKTAAAAQDRTSGENLAGVPPGLVQASAELSGFLAGFVGPH